MIKNNVIAATVEKVPFYNQNIFNTLISVFAGFILSLITTYIANRRSDAKEKTENRRNTLVLITQNHYELFNLIYLGANHPCTLDYTKLREELKKRNIIFLLPEDLKKEFELLYSIYFNGAYNYNKNKSKIPQILNDITIKLSKYGVDVFGYK